MAISHSRLKVIISNRLKGTMDSNRKLKGIINSRNKECIKDRFLNISSSLGMMLPVMQ